MLPVVILHGWSDNSDSFVPLASWLKEQGFNVTNIYLGDYLSMNDEITLYDLGSAFQKALKDKQIPLTRYSFDLVVHSTGGLVAREFLRQVCPSDASATPVKHLCMMAPANFGSPLAKLGKSVLGRFSKGWDWDHLGQTGEEILNALELASPYSWALAQVDLFNEQFKVFDPANTMATVLVGTTAYTGIRSVMHEDGSDGTVRVSTANLNAHYFEVDFTNPENPSFKEKPRNVEAIALGVLARNHTTIHDPTVLNQQQEWHEAVIRSLSVEADQYAGHVVQCRDLTTATYAAGMAGRNSSWYHQFEHVVFRVKDQFGHPVEDYVIEFYEEDDPKDKTLQKIHGDILAKVTTNSTDSSYRSFLFDITDLLAFLHKKPDTEISMSLTAANLSERVIYRNPKEGGIEVFTTQDQRFLRPHEPVLVDITLCRDTGDEVFKLKLA